MVHRPGHNDTDTIQLPECWCANLDGCGYTVTIKGACIEDENGNVINSIGEWRRTGLPLIIAELLMQVGIGVINRSFHEVHMATAQGCVGPEVTRELRQAFRSSTEGDQP